MYSLAITILEKFGYKVQLEYVTSKIRNYNETLLWNNCFIFKNNT